MICRGDFSWYLWKGLRKNFLFLPFSFLFLFSSFFLNPPFLNLIRSFLKECIRVNENQPSFIGEQLTFSINLLSLVIDVSMKAVFLIIFLVYTLRNCLLYYLKHNYKGRYTLSDMSLQHVHFAATNHPVCTGRAISCGTRYSDNSARVYSVNQEIFRENLCLRNKLHEFNLIWFCETHCSDKMLLRRQRFLQNSGVRAKRFVAPTCRRDVFSATCRLVCSYLKSLF